MGRCQAGHITQSRGLRGWERAGSVYTAQSHAHRRVQMTQPAHQTHRPPPNCFSQAFLPGGHLEKCDQETESIQPLSPVPSSPNPRAHCCAEGDQHQELLRTLCIIFLGYLTYSGRREPKFISLGFPWASTFGGGIWGTSN